MEKPEKWRIRRNGEMEKWRNGEMENPEKWKKYCQL